MTAAVDLAGTGLFTDVSFTRYLDIQAANFSKLKELARSPLQYLYRLDNPKDSNAMTLGRAAHVATLEPYLFEQQYALWDERTESGTTRPRRGKDFDFFAECHKGKEILLADEWNRAKVIAAALRGDPRVMRYLAAGQPEVSLVWRDAGTGRTVKGRVDWLTKLDGVDHLVGIKTARDIRMRQFGAACAQMGYHMQWSIYFDGYCALTGVEPRVVECVVESNPPHDIAVFVIPPEVIDLGREHYAELLELLGNCEKSGEWLGSMPGEQMLQLPEWMFGGDEDLGGLDLEGGADE